MLIDPALEWSTANGPPNWVFIVALLSSPHLWAKYVKQAAKNAYERYTGGA